MTSAVGVAVFLSFATHAIVNSGRFELAGINTLADSDDAVVRSEDAVADTSSSDDAVEDSRHSDAAVVESAHSDDAVKDSARSDIAATNSSRSETTGFDGDYIFLSGGGTRYICDLVKYGIDRVPRDLSKLSKDELRMAKIGFGLYFTVYRAGRDASTGIVQASGKWEEAPWDEFVWSYGKPNFASIGKFRLDLDGDGRRSGPMRFALVPRELWYERGPSSLNDYMGCHESYDALFLPYTTGNTKFPRHNKLPPACTDALDWAKDSRNVVCREYSAKEVKNFIDLGCIQELKVNPRSEHRVQLVDVVDDYDRRNRNASRYRGAPCGLDRHCRETDFC